MDLWKSYLFESHSEDTFRCWAKRLSFFRFFRAYGGHANDSDSLDVAFRYRDIAQLKDFFSMIGVPLLVYQELPPQPKPGVSYRVDEFTKFPSLIPNTQCIQQPGYTTVAEQGVFIWCDKDSVKISINAEYSVSEANVVSAEVVERKLLAANLERIDPPVKTRNYICPQYYPEYFG